jgi:hypothetical protein
MASQPHSAGLGYSVDLDRTPVLGRLLPLPGRVGAETFGWKRESPERGKDERAAHHLDGDGVGYGVRYEQFLSNLFGIHSGLRVYSPPSGGAPIRDADQRRLLEAAGGLTGRPCRSRAVTVRIGFLARCSCSS